jgi:hypothetical protein
MKLFISINSEKLTRKLRFKYQLSLVSILHVYNKNTKSNRGRHFSNSPN